MVGEFKEDYESTKCLEFGDVSGGDGEAPACLKTEHIFFKKGDSIKATQFSFQVDDSSGEITGDVSVPYQNGYVVVPISKINILDSKDTTVEKRNEIKNDLKTGVKIGSSAIVMTNSGQSFLQKHKNHLLIAVALVAGYFAYKKFKK